jgi:metal-responsive CopG/Arc/MetJ family transcriptional regulator
MDSKIISISVPVAMLSQIDEAAAVSYQTRSNFIRMAIVEKFGAKSQYELRRPVTRYAHY